MSLLGSRVSKEQKDQLVDAMFCFALRVLNKGNGDDTGARCGLPSGEELEILPLILEILLS
jgi:hypothetical protein